MTCARLAIDLDDVVFDTTAWLKRHWKSCRGPEIVETRWDLGSPDTMREVLVKFHDYGVGEVKPISGAVKILKRLIAQRCDIVFVSARPALCWDATADALENLGIRVRAPKHEAGKPRCFRDTTRDADLLLVDELDKVAEVLALCDAQHDYVLVDDRFSTVVRATELGLPAMLFDRPWNQQYAATPIPRVEGWLGKGGLAEALEL